MRNVPISSASPCALGKRHNARRRGAAGVPDLDEAGFAVFAVGAAEAGPRGQRQLRHLTLRLVAAAPAFDEEGVGPSGHTPRLLRAGLPQQARPDDTVWTTA